MTDFRIPSPEQAAARERLIRAADKVRMAGHHWIADGIVAGATDNLPQEYAADIAAAVGLAVITTNVGPGWLVALVDEDMTTEAAWSYRPDDAEVDR